MSTLLALDQSSHTSGYAVFQNGVLKDYGHFTISDEDLGIRLQKIRQKVLRLVEDYDADEVVFEDIQLQETGTNPKIFKILAEVFGVVYEALTENDISCSFMLAATWKSKLKIKGKTRPEQKKNAQKYVKDNYNIQPTEDECDAICIGVAYTMGQGISFV